MHTLFVYVVGGWFYVMQGQHVEASGPNLGALRIAFRSRGYELELVR